MKVSVNWLRNYVDIKGITIKELSDKLSVSGLEVEGMATSEKVFGVVTAKVLSKEKHPNADKLNICSVTDGNETFTVVCGAPNVEVNQIVAFAKIGAKLPDLTIKEAKIRGVESYGMICSERELGTSVDHGGILVLPDGTALGLDINDFLGLGDTVFELNVTPNRPDWLSVIGVAREISAVFGRKLTLPETKLSEINEKTADLISVEVRDVKKCPIYVARVVKGVKLAPSPLWMQARIRAAGLRPINNVVDVTNYILLEYGQPLHAFDIRMVDKGIIVRNAFKDEKIVALDGKEYIFDKDTLVIADHTKPLAIAGVMGGEYTSVLPDTDTVILECAYFSAINVRETSKRLGLSSDASYRYERGIDYGATLNIADYAASLMAEICGGKVLKGSAGGVVDVVEKVTVTSSVRRINLLLGTNITADEMSGYLNSLFINTKIDGDCLISQIPSFRGDITRECDVAEEVARLFGYDKIETTIPVVKADAELSAPIVEYTRLVRGRLESLGFNETVNFSFMAPEYLKIFDKSDKFVKLLNPISADMAWLRSYVFPAVIKNLQTNRNQGETNIRLFEIATAFKSKAVDKLAEETQKLCLCSTADFMDVSWVKNKDVDAFYYLKGVLDNIFGVLGLKSEYSPLVDCHFLHPGKSANIIVNGNNAGFIGALHPDVLEKIDMKAAIYVAEVDFSKICEIAAAHKICYEKFSRFPFAERDFALIVEDSVNIGDLLGAVRASSQLITDTVLFDVFVGAAIGEGKKSIAFRVRFSDLDKTLSDDDINPIIENVLNRLDNLFGAKLR